MTGDQSEAAVLQQISKHVYAAINDGESVDELTHGHLEKAYNLLQDTIDDPTAAGVEVNDTNVVSGSFLAEDMYPVREELESRVFDHVEQEYAPLPGDYDIDDVELRWAALEDGVVLYRVEHPRMGVFKSL